MFDFEQVIGADDLMRVVAAQFEIAKFADNIDKVMDVAAKQAQDLTQASGGAIQIRDGDNMAFRAVSGIANEHIGLRVPIAGSLVGECLRTGSPQYCSDARTDAFINQDAVAAIGILSLLLVPLSLGVEIIGVVVVMSEHPNAFTDLDIGRLRLISGMIATAMSHAAASSAQSQLLIERADAIKQLHEGQSLYLTSLDAIQEGYIIHDRVGLMKVYNVGAEKILGTSLGPLATNSPDQLGWIFTGPDGAVISNSDLPRSRCVMSGQPETALLRLTLPHKDLWLSITSSPLTHVGETDPYASVTTFQDVTERFNAEQKLKQSEQLFRTSMHAMQEGLVLQDETGTILLANESAEKILGMTIDQMQGRSSLDPRWRAIHEDGNEFLGGQHPAMVALILGIPQIDVVMGVYKPSGELSWLLINAMPIFEVGADAPSSVVTTFTDITSRKQVEKDLRAQSEVLSNQKYELEEANKQMDAANRRLKALVIEDGMTRLKNHRGFQEQMTIEVRRAKRHSHDLSLIMLDVDHFKAFNDKYGHPQGDLVLQQVADILRLNSRGTDTAARYGGEEFALILPETDSAGALVIADRIRTEIEQAVWTKRKVTVSIGVCSLSEGNDSSQKIIKHADLALYASKSLGRNCVSVRG